LNYSRGTIRRRILEEKRRQQKRKLQLEDPDGISLQYSRPKAFVSKAIVNNKENIIFHNGKSLYCAILHKEASHGRANFATGGGFSRPGGVGTVYKINILTGRLIPHNRDSDEHEGKT
jgi:hypothetical protein